MALWLERLAEYHKGKGNKSRADMYTALAAQESLYKTPETFSDVIVLPEGVIRLPDLTIGEVKPKELEKALGNKVTDYARDLLRSKDFIILPKQKAIGLVIATPSVMGLSGNPTTDQIFDRADKLNWNLCPAEVGPHLVLALNDQPEYKNFQINLPISIGMKQIAGRRGDPFVFGVGRGDGGSWLGARWAGPTVRWNPESRFVFSPRK